MAKRIEAVGVTSYYGSFKAIDGVTMTIEPKSVTALIGPSGCGKSTLLRVVAGLEAPDSGSVRMGGRDITKLEPRDRDLPRHSW